MRMRMMPVLLIGAVAGGCSESARAPTQPESLSVPLHVESARQPGVPENHRTHLSGAEEVFTPSVPGGPTPADSRAQGQAIFQVSRTGDSVDYRLIASNIENVIMAHIHCGPAGTNGPIVVWLYPSPSATAALPAGAGRHNGVLAEGTFDTSHVRSVPSSPACPGGVSTLEQVLAKIRAGHAYVNVHTNDGVAPANTGPGDFPGGEVRGQIE